MIHANRIIPGIRRYIFHYKSNKRSIRYLQYLARIIWISISRFLNENAFMHASAVSYATVISLIPVLTVGLALVTITTGLNDKKEILFLQINKVLLKNNLALNLDPYFETLSDIINSATKIGTIGFIFLIFSATGILRSLESSFNSIWKIKDERPIIQKFIYYFFILSVGPLLIFSAFSGISKISEYIRQPHLHALTVYKNMFWASGDKGTILALDNNGKILFQLNERYLDKENIVCKAEDLSELDVCYPEDLKSYKLKLISSDDNRIYAASNDGLILFSDNPMKRWKLILFKGISIEYIYPLGDFIYLLQEKGKIIKYDTVTSKIEILSTAEDKIVPLAIAFTGTEFLVAGEKGYLGFYTPSFTFIHKTRLSNSGLTNIHQINHHIFISGERGLIYFSENDGKTWSKIKHKNYNYSHVITPVASTDTILTINETGNILVSHNHGSSWNLLDTIESRFNDIAFIGNQLLAVGDFQEIATAKIDNAKMEAIHKSGGKQTFSLFSIFNFFIFLFFMWAFFWFLYSFLPGTSIPFRASALSGFITSILFYVFIEIFNIYLQSFTGTTQIIYKTLAAIPIFLLTIYCVSVIIIFGAVITSVIHFKEYNDKKLHSPIKKDKVNFGDTLTLFHFLYTHSSKTKDFPHLGDLKKDPKFSSMNMSPIIQTLQTENLITTDHSLRIIPLRRPEEINLLDLNFINPERDFYYQEDILSREGKEILAKFSNILIAELKNITLKDILNL